MTGEPAQIQPAASCRACRTTGGSSASRANIGDHPRPRSARTDRPAGIDDCSRSTPSIRFATASRCCAARQRSSGCSRCQFDRRRPTFDVAVHAERRSRSCSRPSRRSGHAYGDVTGTVRGMIARLDGNDPAPNCSTRQRASCARSPASTGSHPASTAAAAKSSPNARAAASAPARRAVGRALDDFDRARRAASRHRRQRGADPVARLPARRRPARPVADAVHALASAGSAEAFARRRRRGDVDRADRRRQSVRASRLPPSPPAQPELRAARDGRTVRADVRDADRDRTNCEASSAAERR